ncbi:hypothetical protein GGS20DRAFT_320571 [Poronia punctata]|nr:hypothetical protein GGS20DRAFT_320571 [Poronia punctata]
MTSKELLGDAVVTLTKKARRSLASRKGKTGFRQACNGEHDPQQEGILNPDSLGPKGLIAPQFASTITVNSHAESCNESPSTPRSTEWVDDEPKLSQPHVSERQVTDQAIIDLATSSFPTVPANIELPRLTKPVLIPRVAPGSSVPFARAWAPALTELAVTKEDFVTFVDNMNTMITPHAAFRALQVAAIVVSFIPYDAAEGVGGALEAIAILGAAAMNYKRVKGYLSLMNENYFHPRGLHVKIVDTKRMKKMVGLDKKDHCLAPLTEQTLELSIQGRCLRYLSKYTCDLSFDVPAPSPATTTLAKITTWEIRHKIRQADKSARQSRKRTWKRYQKGKKLQGRWEGRGERQTVKSLDWLLIQDLDEWKAQKMEKEAKKEEK